MNTSLCNSRAVTIVEVLTVVTVAVGVFLIVFYSFSSFNKTASVNAAVQITLSVIEEARTKTLASEGGSVYGVHFNSSEVALFKGGTYNISDPENETKKFSSAVTISGTTLQGGGSDIVFDRLTGKTSQYGTITFSSTDGVTTRTIIIEATGIASE